MPELGALLLSTQAVAAPGELLNLALHAGTVGPEAAVLVAMIATLLVDLAGEKFQFAGFHPSATRGWGRLWFCWPCSGINPLNLRF